MPPQIPDEDCQNMTEEVFQNIVKEVKPPEVKTVRKDYYNLQSEPVTKANTVHFPLSTANCGT